MPRVLFLLSFFTLLPFSGDEVMISRHIGNLSHKQEAALQRFKEAVKDIPNKPDDSDTYYLRWLRAKNFKVCKSKKMFINVSIPSLSLFS